MNWEEWRRKDSWDNLWSRPYVRYRRHHELFWKLIRDKSSGKILDMGCGPACIWEGTNFDITGVDFSEEGIREARKNVPGGRFIVSDIIDIPLNEEFDTIVLCGVVNYFPDLVPLHDEVKRLSKSGTKVIITINDKKGLNTVYWSNEEADREFSKWGNVEGIQFFEGVGWLIVIEM